MHFCDHLLEYSCYDYSGSVSMPDVQIHIGLFGADHYYTVTHNTMYSLISAFANQHDIYQAFYSTDGKRHAYDLSQVDFIRTV